MCGPDGYSAKLFSTSRIEVFFSLKGVARHAVCLVLVSDRWESWLSQVADAETKQAMRQHLHLSKLFFLIYAVISKITMQRYELYFWHCPHLSAYVRICPEMSAFVRFRHSNVSYCRCKVTKKYFGIVTLVSPYA